MANATATDSRRGKGSVARPLSPHLEIYSLSISMAMSIIHRITGGALFFGTALLAWWLIAAASGPDYFNYVNAIFGSILGRIVLFGYTWALLHHMFGGIRHLIWDTGRGFDLGTVDRMCWISLFGSIGATIVIWLLASF